MLMPTPSKTMPTLDAVRRLLSDLFGRPVTFTKSPVLAGPPKDKVVAAFYTGDDGTVTVIAMADVRFAVMAGACLTGFPTPMAERQIETDQIDDMVMENFREIMNVCGTLFSDGKTAHARLAALHRIPPAEWPADMAERTKRPAGRLDGTATFPNYGSGRLSFLVL